MTEETLAAMPEPSNEQGACSFAPSPQPWWRRWLERCFPSAPLPQIGEHPNGVTSQIYAGICWADRLRLLVSGVMRVVVQVDFEEDPGGIIRTRSVVWVAPPGGLAQLRRSLSRPRPE